MREDPDVRVRDLIAADLTPDCFGIKSFLLCFRDFGNCFEICAGIWRIPYPAIVLFGDYLDVARGARRDIHKCEERVVFVDFCRGNFSLHNLAKNTVGHEGSIAKSNIEICDIYRTVGELIWAYGLTDDGEDDETFFCRGQRRSRYREVLQG